MRFSEPPEVGSITQAGRRYIRVFFFFFNNLTAGIRHTRKLVTRSMRTAAFPCDIAGTRYIYPRVYGRDGVGPPKKSFESRVLNNTTKCRLYLLFIRRYFVSNPPPRTGNVFLFFLLRARVLRSERLIYRASSNLGTTIVTNCVTKSKTRVYIIHTD